MGDHVQALASIGQSLLLQLFLNWCPQIKHLLSKSLGMTISQMGRLHYDRSDAFYSQTNTTPFPPLGIFLKNKTLQLS